MSVTDLSGILPAISADDFRAACGLFPSGVTVVTRMLHRRPFGMTVSSFTSVSLDPPLILVCIDKRAAFLQNLDLGLSFAVNVLSEGQEHLARRFSDREEDDRFAGANWRRGWNGVPILNEVVSYFACRLDQMVEAGDHHILIGRVEHLERGDGRPIVWCERDYHCLPTIKPSEENF